MNGMNDDNPAGPCIGEAMEVLERAVLVAPEVRQKHIEPLRKEIAELEAKARRIARRAGKHFGER